MKTETKSETKSNERARLNMLIKSAKPDPGSALSEKQIAVLKTAGEVVLITAAVAGTLMLGAALPGIFKAVSQLRRYKYQTYNSRRERLNQYEKAIRRSLYYYKSQNYIDLIPMGEDFLVKVRQKGRRFEKKFNFDTTAINFSGKWDRNWWLVLADIPIKHKYAADKFRKKLRQMRFYFLQRTVWIIPFDPRDEIDFVSSYLRIDQFVTVMKVSQLDPEDLTKVRKFYEKGKLLP